ncbi:MAG TPA: PxKF domain-containing protein, partial [Gemmatimonadaceae bacterium]|nr:PxKF domain-containing protein [Gemmatimonadaceae bacterium]
LTPSTCTVSGSQVQLATLGACSIAADQAGAAGYDAATRVVQTFEISSPFNMLSRCGHAITGIAFDGTDYFVGEGHNSLAQCVTRYSSDGVLRETKTFQVDIRGLHFVPASEALTSRTWAGQLHSMNYAAGTQQVLTPYVAALGADQSQPAVDPDGTGFWVMNVPAHVAELHRLSDNVIVRSFAVTGGLESAPAIAVSNSLVFVPSGLTVRGYDKVSGDLVSTISVPLSTEGCNGYGFGASASGDRIMYSSACNLAHVELIQAPGTQTIQFTSSPAAPIYGGSYTVTATGGASGNAVTFTSETPSVCTISGSLVTFAGVGTCTVAAHQPGGNNYLHADDVTQSFSVAKAPQVVAFSTTPVTPARLGGSYVPSATSNTGLPVTYATVGSCTLDGSTVRFGAVGQCIVQAIAAGNALYLDGSMSQGFNVFYQFTGFAAPIANAPAVNTATAGSIIKIKFSLAGNQGLDVIAGGWPTYGILTTPCNATGTPASTAPANTADFKYDPVVGQYVYSWQTESSWAGSCRQFALLLNDGSMHLAHFQFDAVTKTTAVLSVTPTTAVAGVPANLEFTLDVAAPSAIAGITGIPCPLPEIPAGATTYKGSCTLKTKFPTAGKLTYAASVQLQNQSTASSNSVSVTVGTPPAPTVTLSSDVSSVPVNQYSTVTMALSISSATPITSFDAVGIVSPEGSRCIFPAMAAGSTSYTGTCSFIFGRYAKTTKVSYSIPVTVEGRAGATYSNTVTVAVTK